MALFPIVADADTQPFLKAAGQGQFQLVRSKSTGEYLEPRIDHTQDPDLELATAAGTGTVVSWTVARGRDREGNPTQTGLGIVELTEGPWWWCRIDGIGDESPTGKSGHFEFEKSGPADHHASLPYFVLD